jgi:hypothetical protein
MEEGRNSALTFDRRVGKGPVTQELGGAGARVSRVPQFGPMLLIIASTAPKTGCSQKLSVIFCMGSRQ